MRFPLAPLHFPITTSNILCSADCGVFGGWPYLAYEYVKTEGGIQTEEDYPYCCGLGGDKGGLFKNNTIIAVF